ncbi:hypothetical protein BC827DRAFT_921592 [Russula dissimulans]|nr:hypothetical protein BC827DRAFT_921592 [Russula dissimulans]
MVHFNDPVVLTRDFVALVKFWHAVGGLYIWEFFTTLDYEWSVIRGRRPYLWTTWLYSLTRVATLGAVINGMIGLNTSGPINCHLWATSGLIVAYAAIATASLLIVLRVIAIWNRNKIVSVIAMSAWVANVSCLIHSKSFLRIILNG